MGAAAAAAAALFRDRKLYVWVVVGFIVSEEEELAVLPCDGRVQFFVAVYIKEFHLLPHKKMERVPVLFIALASNVFFLISVFVLTQRWTPPCTDHNDTLLHIDFIFEGISVGGVLFFLKELAILKLRKLRWRGNLILLTSMIQMSSVFGMMGTQSHCSVQPMTYVMIICGRLLHIALYLDIVHIRTPLTRIHVIAAITLQLVFTSFMSMAIIFALRNSSLFILFLVLAVLGMIPNWRQMISEFRHAGRDATNRNRKALRFLVISIGFFAPSWIFLTLLFYTGYIQTIQLETATCILYGSSNILFSMIWCARENVDDELQIQQVIDEKEAATGANRAKRLFMRYIFHELRVPLNALVLGLDIVHETARIIQNDDIVSTTTVLQVNAIAMNKLLDDFLSLEKIEEGKFVLEVVVFNIADMIREAVRMLEIPLNAKQMTCNIELSPEVPSVLSGDVNKLRQVLCNYISNAIKFSPSGSTLTITGKMVQMEPRRRSLPNKGSLSTVVPAENLPAVRIAVTDQGPGISVGDQAKLFQPFEQIHAGAIQKGNGTGLGLSICKRIIELSNGYVGVISSEGGGSTFFFVMPIGGSGSDSDTTQSPSVTSSPTSIDVKIPLRVAVVVDDVQSNRVFFGRLLQQHGVTTLYYADDGVKTLRLLDTLSADAVTAIQVWFIDKEMPNCDGYECTRALRARGITTTILGVTANALEDDVAQFLSMGVDQVIIKPVTLDLLRTVLASRGFSFHR